jgi:hypothetical protein
MQFLIGLFAISLYVALWQIFGLIPTILIVLTYGCVKVAIEEARKRRFVRRALEPMIRLQRPPRGYEKTMAMRHKLGYDT